jgi:hypothetical protein
VIPANVHYEDFVFFSVIFGVWLFEGGGARGWSDVGGGVWGFIRSAILVVQERHESIPRGQRERERDDW